MTFKFIQASSFSLLFLLPLFLQAQVEKLSPNAYDEYLKRIHETVKNISAPSLKAHLERAEVKGGKNAVNAMRVHDAAQGKIAKDEVVFFSVPPMGETQYLPDTFPFDGAAMSEVRIIAARNEYEPGSFILYPLKTFGKVSLELGEFKDSEGRIFPAEQLDLKVVKVWYQNGNAWYSYFGDDGLKLVPELLLNDENLIKVDTKEIANYARLTEKDGSLHYQWISAPPAVDKGFSKTAYRGSKTFKPMRENFQDAKTLQAVSLNEGEFKQFFLTAHVTSEIQPGVYSGRVSLLHDGKKIGYVPVLLRVLPFELPAPKTYFDVTRDFVVGMNNYISYEYILKENGGDTGILEMQYLNIMKNFKAHNQLSHQLREGNIFSHEFRRTLALMKEAGLETDRLVGAGEVKAWLNPYQMKQHAELQKQWFLKNLGHQNIYLIYGNENGPSWVVDHRSVFDTYKRAGFKFIFPGHHKVFYKCGYFNDFFKGPSAPEDREATRMWNEIGDVIVTWYAQQHVGPENPAFNRRQYGMAPYLGNNSANYNYAHHLGDYNDRCVYSYRPMVFSYGCYDGVIDTIQWEAFREGIDDIRYATLLKSMALKANQSGNYDVKNAGRQVLQYFACLNPAEMDLSEARLEMIRMILKLQKTLSENKE